MPAKPHTRVQPEDRDDEDARKALKNRQEKVQVALAGLAAAHTQKMQQTSNRSWLMHYYDDLFSHSWDNRGQVAQIAQAEGRKVVGTFCVFAPDELIYAAGGFPIRLDAGGDESIAEGELELGTVNLCPMIKSSMGLKRLDLPFAGEAQIDLALIPSVCDGKKKLVEIFSRYVPTWMVQVPHTSLDPRVRDYWRTEIRLLRENLEDFTGHKIKAKELGEAIRLYNRKRKAVRRLYEIRKAQLPPISGRDALLVMATMYHDDPRRWVEQTERLCLEMEDRVRRGIGVGEPDDLRLMLAGCPIVPPNWKVPDILEELGGIIVTDELCTGSRGHWYLVGEDGRNVDEMVTALADRYIMCECPCFVPNTPRMKRIIESVKDWQVRGVVYYQLTFCHTLNIEAVEVERALERVGIPMCKIDTDYSEQGAEAMRTRLESFLETLGGGRGSKKPIAPGDQPAPFWTKLFLPPELTGEMPAVAAARVQSGPLRSKGETAATAAPRPAAPGPASKPVRPAAESGTAPAPATPPASRTRTTRTIAAKTPGAQPSSGSTSAEAATYQLVTSDGAKIPLLVNKEYTIGRDGKSATAIDLAPFGGDADQGISRKHARLVVTRLRCFLEDLGSKNGTFVNDRRLASGERCPLSGGEQLRVGLFPLVISKVK